MKHPLSTALQHIRRVLGAPTESAESDRALLERFTQEHDEPAFRALVQRHGPMVLGVCRRLLDHPQDAEDAFQATFLVLVRRARAIPWQDSVGHWLHRVAYRVSLKARAKRAYRRATEKQCEVMVSDGRPEAS